MLSLCRKVNSTGKGTYGVVYHAVDRPTGNVVALKQCLPHNECSNGSPLTMLQEIMILRKFEREGGGDHSIIELRDLTVLSRWVMACQNQLFVCTTLNCMFHVSVLLLCFGINNNLVIACWGKLLC
jgi:hypothetical protein